MIVKVIMNRLYETRVVLTIFRWMLIKIKADGPTSMCWSAKCNFLKQHLFKFGEHVIRGYICLRFRKKQ